MKRHLHPVLGWYVLRHVQHVIGVRFDDIAPLASMARLSCPVLLVHGTDDAMVPFDDARRLQAAGQAGAVQCIAVPGGHDPSHSLGEYLPELVEFLQRSFAVATPDVLIAPTTQAP